MTQTWGTKESNHLVELRLVEEFNLFSCLVLGEATVNSPHHLLPQSDTKPVIKALTGWEKIMGKKEKL